MARDPHTKDCAIKGCTRAAGRSGLCTSHHKLVPMSMTRGLSAAIMQQSHALAQKHHKQWVKYVQLAINSGNAVQRATIPASSAQMLGMAAARGKR